MIDVLRDDGIVAPLTNEHIVEIVLVSAVAANIHCKPTLCLRFASDEVVQQLNAEWRNKNRVTDILSFPMQDMDAWECKDPWGDMVLAMPFVEQEAKRLAVPVADHVSHLIVHGTLHLLGFDHIEDDEAETMQQLENKIMARLYLHTPYPELGNE